MDDFRNKTPSTANEDNTSSTSISCDSCLRANSSCVGGPRCERCYLNGFECIFSPGEANISELKNAFASLLLPGQMRPETFSGSVNSALPVWNEKGNEALPDRRHGSGRKASGRCAVCRQLRKRCGKEKPKCRSCEDEGFECGYEAQGVDGIGEVGVQFEGGQSKNIFDPTETRIGPKCDTCRVWKAHCDARKPTCSSCQLRGVECRYIPNRDGSFGDPILPKPKRLDPNPNRPPMKYPAPKKSWQTPSLPPSLSAYYGTSPPKASPVSRPLGQMYSTPSGCISCFESKEKCLPSFQRVASGNNPCIRCAARNTECKPFPTGTRLIACDACTKSYKLCTNHKNGLRCDSCDEAGLECSRTSPAQSTVLSNPHSRPPPTSSENPPLRPRRSCDTCQFLQRVCDEKSPRCSVCEEVGVSCRYPAWIVPILDSEPPQLKPQDTSCHSCKELDLVCDGALPTCFYCKELGRDCQRVVEAPVSPFEITTRTNPQMIIAGCSTCKARRVRCGRQLPTCQNCKLSGLVCAGYHSEANLDGQHAVKQDEKLELKVDKKATEVVQEEASGSPEKDIHERPKVDEHDGKAHAPKGKPENSDGEGDQDDWETITHTEALGDGKPGEFGVVELD